MAFSKLRGSAIKGHWRAAWRAAASRRSLSATSDVTGPIHGLAMGAQHCGQGGRLGRLPDRPTQFLNPLCAQQLSLTEHRFHGFFL